MPIQKVNIETFLELAAQHQIIDVRSPAEFAYASIPGAFSLPLFTDEERKIVGTAYKQQSKQHAIKLGLAYLGKKMVNIIEEVEKLLEVQIINTEDASIEPSSDTPRLSSKKVLIHCWRGGMRSGGVAYLLDLYGFKVYTLAGGYKSFRQWALKQFEKEYDFKLLGGYTGSGKTEVLQALKTRGQKVIDLEDLANHKGSAFGNIGLPPQPSQEMFENKLAIELWKVEQCQRSTVKHAEAEFSRQDNQDNKSNLNYSNSSSTTIWLEDESQRIGTVNIPMPLWLKIRSKHLYFLNVPFEERLNHIIEWYGKGDKEKLISAITRIQKRLGGLETRTAINFLLEDNIRESASVLLHYYDRWYLKGLQSRDNWERLVTEIECDRADFNENSLKLLHTIQATDE